MNKIKLFKYRNMHEFEEFLSAYGYKLENVKGFKFAWKEQYHGNVLKVYSIHFDDGECEYFKVVFFKDFGEYRQSRLGFNGERLLRWYEDVNLRAYKLKDTWDSKDSYAFES